MNWVAHKQYGKERELHSLQKFITPDCTIHFTIGTVRQTNDGRWTWIFFQKDAFVKLTETVQGTEATLEEAKIKVERCAKEKCMGCGSPAYIPSKGWRGSFLCKKCEPSDERLAAIMVAHCEGRD